MQTFVPYESFEQSAAVLDGKRLGKQRVEAKQILLALGCDVGDHKAKPSRWANHPAVAMWRGCEHALAEYGMAVCCEWRRRGYMDSLLEQFDAVWARSCGWRQMPAWLGREDVHASHRSNLLRKDPAHYGQFGWLEPADLPYVWPVSEKNFANAGEPS